MIRAAILLAASLEGVALGLAAALAATLAAGPNLLVIVHAAGLSASQPASPNGPAIDRQPVVAALPLAEPARPRPGWFKGAAHARH
jgi:hypothetical protein